LSPLIIYLRITQRQSHREPSQNDNAPLSAMSHLSARFVTLAAKQLPGGFMDNALTSDEQMTKLNYSSEAAD